MFIGISIKCAINLVTIKYNTEDYRIQNWTVFLDQVLLAFQLNLEAFETDSEFKDIAYSVLIGLYILNTIQ